MRSTILVVDDHAVTREPLARLLRFEGYDASSAANGVEALQALERLTPDLVLLDLMMPKMNGVEFLQAVRADARWRSLPVIALTGSFDPRLLDRLHHLGTADVISKARFSIEQLLTRIRAHAPCAAAG